MKELYSNFSTANARGSFKESSNFINYDRERPGQILPIFASIMGHRSH